MKVLITGADGFIGKNLQITLANNESIEVVKFTADNDLSELESMVVSSDFIFHLAGINRPKNEDEFFTGNADLTKLICSSIEKSGKNIPIIFSSSIQAENTSPYGKSKLQAEMHLLNLYMETGNKVYIYRLPGVFGKWCRPNYNSVVATFCHNISHNLPVQINDPDFELNLVHVGSVVESFIDVLMNRLEGKLFIEVKPVYKVSLANLAEQLYKFKESRNTLITEAVGTGFVRVLYATYLSYLPPKDFSYPLIKHEDPRGSFVEMLKTKDSGQFSFFTAHPGITRGGHYHQVKNEKFLVIKGKAHFGFRHIITNETYNTLVSAEKPEVVETVPGWSHDITNVGDEELIVMLWANEVFDKQAPDTVTHKV